MGSPNKKYKPHRHSPLFNRGVSKAKNNGTSSIGMIIVFLAAGIVLLGGYVHFYGHSGRMFGGVESGVKPGFPGLEFGFLQDLESESTAEYAAEKAASETAEQHFREEAAPDAAHAPDDKTVVMDVGEVLAFPQAEPVQEKVEEVQQAAEAVVEDVHAADVHEAAEPQADTAQADHPEATSHEALQRFMDAAREPSPEAEVAVLDTIRAQADLYSSKDISTNEAFVEARKQLFQGILESEDATGALVWIMAHWHLSTLMPSDWKDWTETNIVNGAPPVDIITVYRDALPNHEAVSGVIGTFRMFDSNRWHLRIGVKA